MPEFKKQFGFLGHDLAPGRKPLIVAEVGFNHNGDVELAEVMIRAARDNGADAVKLQTFIGRELYAETFRAQDPDNPGVEIPFYEFWERYQLTRDDYRRLFAFAERLNIPLFSTPFDEGSLAMLLDLGVQAVKIASGDLTHTSLLKAAGAAGVPVVLSSGMATEAEAGRALEVLHGAGARQVALLHCVSHYPARPDEMNLNVIPRLRERFGVPVGLSDHTLDSASSVVATALGAVMIEKHFTTDRNLHGADQRVSLDPQGLRELRQAVDQTRQTLGTGDKEPQESELPTLKGARRSVVARETIAAGTPLERDMLAFKRPCNGVPAEDVAALLGRSARVDIPAETAITWEMVESRS